MTTTAVAGALSAGLAARILPAGSGCFAPSALNGVLLAVAHVLGAETAVACVVVVVGYHISSLRYIGPFSVSNGRNYGC